jgi:general stress protein YciG
MPRDQANNGRRPAKRGFAAMDPERQREIARKGGASVPDEKRSFSQDRDLAAAAGRKGGEASHGGGRSSSRNRNATDEEGRSPRV